MITNPIISIDRTAQRFAMFDDFTIIGDFQSYTNEEVAIKVAKTKFAILTDKEPQVVYPRIDKIVYTYARTRKSKGS